MFESVFDSALVEGGGGILEDGGSVWFVLYEFAFEVGSVAVEDLALSFLHAVPEIAHKAISIAVNDLGVALEDAPFPGAVDFDLPGYDLVGAPAVPEVIEPLALVDLPGGIVVVGADAIPEIVLEGAVIVVAVGVVHGALEWR